MAVDRVTAGVLAPDDDELERSLRPRRLDEFVGQERVKEQLAIALEAAKARGEALDHVLLAGPPGLGDRKSTRLNSSHANISYAVFCLKKKNTPLTSAANTLLTSLST